MTATPTEIARPTGLCAASGRVIAPGEAFVAALVEREDASGVARFTREDFALGAWSGGARPTPAEGDARVALVASWRSVMPDAHTPRRQQVSPEEAMDLFESLASRVGELDDRHAALCFLLTLILVRKRVLRVESTKRDAESGRDVLRVRPFRKSESGESPTWEIPDPGLTSADAERIAELAEELAQLMPDAPGAQA
ncbi:MAG: hypothetical protein RBS39_03550 [Phycisphaerales bacterium]|jgi:hypothetical protein|nr:hypothetical protein [Phycisphaerales bacterium]